MKQPVFERTAGGRGSVPKVPKKGDDDGCPRSLLERGGRKQRREKGDHRFLSDQGTIGAAKLNLLRGNCNVVVSRGQLRRSGNQEQIRNPSTARWATAP